MNNLKSFLAQNKVKVSNIKYVVSNNFIDDNGEPMNWELRALSNTEFEELRKNCTTKRLQKNGMYTLETDNDIFQAKLCATCVVFPDLKNVELQNSYGVMGEEDLLKNMLSPGEYANLGEEIIKLNGFDKNVNNKVEEAKN